MLLFFLFQLKLVFDKSINLGLSWINILAMRFKYKILFKEKKTIYLATV